MKKLIPLFLLLFCLQTAYGQKIRFTDTSNKWVYEHTQITGPIYRYYTDDYYVGDTVISGVKYSIGYGGASLYRDDTLLNKVFARLISSPTEYVLYDYNIQQGDTFINSSEISVVEELDSISINNIWYKTWRIRMLSGIDIYRFIIEGIGLFHWESIDNSMLITCFKNKGNVMHGSNYINSANCALSINNIPAKSTTATITPNPANERSKIIFPYTIQSGSLYITNMLGQVVIQRSIVNSEQMYLGNGITADGVYFYKVTDNQTGNNFTGRFVYQ